jgi:hypothetical protein
LHTKTELQVTDKKALVLRADSAPAFLTTPRRSAARQRMRGAARLSTSLLLLAGAWLLDGQQEAGPAGGVAVSGVVKLMVNDHVAGWTSERTPHEPVRLCSPDEVLETQTDGKGEFRFRDVPPGRYDLVTAGRYYAPATIAGVQVGNRDVESLTVTEGPGVARPSHCVKSEYNCAATDWVIEYEKPTNQRLAVLYGVVNAQRGTLAGAWVSVSRAGEKRGLAGGMSDGEGRFQFLLTPGYYTLKVTRDGFQSVDATTFLVPLRNPTKVTISTLPVGGVVVCQ